jgi:hypothetical protein
MFKHVQPLSGQGFGVAEALSLYVSGEVIDRFHDQSSIDRAGFLQFFDVRPARDKPASLQERQEALELRLYGH